LRIGFIAIAIALLIEGILGILGYDIWIRNRGLVKITFVESLSYIVFSIIIFIVIYSQHNKENQK
jgi:hypothetical protein